MRIEVTRVTISSKMPNDSCIISCASSSRQFPWLCTRCTQDDSREATNAIIYQFKKRSWNVRNNCTTRFLRINQNIQGRPLTLSTCDVSLIVLRFESMKAISRLFLVVISFVVIEFNSMTLERFSHRFPQWCLLPLHRQSFPIIYTGNNTLSRLT